MPNQILKLSEENDYIRIIDEDLVMRLLPKRDRVSHKGTYGRAVHFCGSYGMAGAAAISAKAALYSGVGMVSCVLPKSIYNIVSALVPEAVFDPLSCSKYITLMDKRTIKTCISKADAILVGCGIGCKISVKKAVKYIIKESNSPIVLDADGINCVADSIDFIEQNGAGMVITPHIGEMSRLTGLSAEQILKDHISIALDFAVKHKTVVVLKCAYTVVATPKGIAYVNIHKGNSGMAVAGCGDMLAGMISSLIAQGVSPADASILAVYLHAECGDMVAEVGSERSVTPTDMIAQLPTLFKKYE